MLNKFRQLREQRDQGDNGFTLIELLVVVVIIGILIAIAIPLYLNYQKGAKNKSAASDVRNAVAQVEQCYSDGGNAYPLTVADPGAGADVVIACGNTGAGTLKVSSGNDLQINVDSPATHYVLVAKSGSPGDKAYCYDSAVGGAPKEEAGNYSLGSTSCA
jgi:type IV pilus assembly protein PilA